MSFQPKQLALLAPGAVGLDDAIPRSSPISPSSFATAMSLPRSSKKKLAQ
ncbi:hypothetical protein FHS31_003059 [Sphingomonas vulcanisoli]|uniref:Uncharacterized protein n=1 Tax=Sphingomonas vulcanisoli TaxID=1658060 RepID=A0ABX0TV67_9SPHN|nr:hypothetical protein [Sphingomonas vulcanisoli]NIJ09427.1 hypothetical protein [Sphingomonas vulcanisoli]